jgi:hypothetical protein
MVRDGAFAPPHHEDLTQGYMLVRIFKNIAARPIADVLISG